MSMTSEQVRRLREFAKTLTYADEYNLVNGAADTIEELSAKLHKSQMERSSQYYNGGWIPVSERLPEEEIAGCLVTVMDTDIVTQDEFENVYPDIVGYDSEYGTWNDCNGISIPFEVIAWMPLPKPYGGDADAGID